MTPDFALGCRRDNESRRTQRQARDFLHRLHAGMPMPEACSHEASEAPIMDQGSSQGCLAHGTSQILCINANAAGAPLPFVPSQDEVYKVLRALERGGNLAPLTDTGGYPADVMAAVSRWGVKAMGPTPPDGRFSDVWPEHVNEEPRLGDLEKAEAYLVVPEYRIDEFASDVVLQVQQAIVGGFAVGISFFADQAFMSFTAGAPPVGAPNMAGPGGGHWSVLDSYRTAPDGSIVFRGPGSWGVGYGDAGHHEVTEAFVRSCWDLYTGPTPLVEGAS